EAGSGFDADQVVDDVGDLWAHVLLASGVGWNVGSPVAGSGEADRGAQPSAGATSVASSSIERRMNGCGGSTECTWKTRSVERSRIGSARRLAMTSSGVPTCTS